MKYDIDDLIALNMAGIGYIRLKKTEPSWIKKILDEKKKDLKREWSMIKKRRVTVLSIFDKDYPAALREIYSPPIVLYIKGKISPEDKTAIAFVGSRRASIYGLNICQSLSGRLAGLGVTIVSGLARGIDSAAHKGALNVEGRTLAVLGNGLNSIYPPENKRLAEKIADSGALISEFPMETPPLAQNFPIRNRIISGLSLGVVIVEAARKSGALITASCALEQGREVFAVPGKAGAVTSTGTHSLIKEGAKLVDSADDIIEELHLKPEPFGRRSIRSDQTNGSSKSKLEGAEKKIYDILSDEPEHIDHIIEESRLPASEVTELLLRLEVKRLVRELPGKNFVVTS